MSHVKEFTEVPVGLIPTVAETVSCVVIVVFGKPKPPPWVMVAGTVPGPEMIDVEVPEMTSTTVTVFPEFATVAVVVGAPN